MGITIRQHLASLVAVFLALLIGVLIGAALSQQPELERVIDGLREDWAAEKQRNDALEAQLEASRRSDQSLVPGLVRGRLSGRRILVAMTSNPEDPDLRDAIRTTLHEAGAVVPITVTFGDDYLDRCEKSGEQALKRAGLPAGARTDGSVEHVAAAAATALAKALLSGDADKLRALRKLVKLDGAANGPFDAAVVAGGSTNADARREDLVDTPLVRALLAHGLIVVGCESSHAEESYIPAYADCRISTVDHADTAAGQVSLVWLLEGHEGHFGVKATADRVSPEMEGL